MLSDPWLTLRQAQEAIRNGRLEEADRLLSQAEVRGHKRSWELHEQIARGYVERGIRHLRREELPAAWTDLLRAEQIGKASNAAEVLRFALVQRGLTDVRNKLNAGEPRPAVEAIAILRQRMVQHTDLEALEEAAQDWLKAYELADRGDFHQAGERLERVRRLLGKRPDGLERCDEQIRGRMQTFSNLLIQLHQAVETAHWSEVMRLAEQVLAVAPQHAEARQAKARAWKAMEPLTVIAARPKKEEPPLVLPASSEPARRVLLWIDGVGGYLICLSNRITLGQATPDAHVDVPIFADVSRLHAAVLRDPEGYMVEAARPIQVNGQAVEKTLLQSGDKLTLGNSCQFHFQLPVPVSTSARLELASPHKLGLSLDGVLLMSDTLVLGPNSQSHVVLRDLKRQVVLFRHKDGLGVRYLGSFTIDGRRCSERSLVGPAVTVSGEDFSFALEPVGMQLGRK